MKPATRVAPVATTEPRPVRGLAKARVNIDSAYLAAQSRRRVTWALGVGKDVAKAKRALGS